MQSKLVIAGGTGFLGSALEKYFLAQNWQVDILTRNPTKPNHHKWNGLGLGLWTTVLENATVLINLCGQSVDCRYTEKNKKIILDSRLLPTRLLHLALENCTTPPSFFMNASSSTIYVHSEDQPMTEKTGMIGCDFSMSVVKKWEAAFFEKEIEGIRKVALRTSIVLGKEGGAYPKLKKITQLGLGGHQGKGNQMVSWIHISDYCRAVQHIIDTKYLEGALNITGPTPLKNIDFMRGIRSLIKPLVYFNQPRWVLELGSLLMQTETELLLKSRYVIPERLMKSGFEFRHETITDLHRSNNSNVTKSLEFVS